MEFLESSVMFWLVTVLYIATRAFDIYSSQNFEAYGLSESIPFSKDKYGNFDTKKNIIGCAVFWAISFLLFLFVTGGAWALLVCLTVGSVFVGLGNLRGKKKNRELQITYLRMLRTIAHLPPIEQDAFFQQLGMMVTRAGRSYYQLFKFVWSEKPINGGAVLDIREKLAELSLRPESEWFPK